MAIAGTVTIELRTCNNNNKIYIAKLVSTTSIATYQTPFVSYVVGVQCISHLGLDSQTSTVRAMGERLRFRVFQTSFFHLFLN